jgi:predicted ester cyclase
MGIEENKDVVRRMVEDCINAYRPDLLDGVVDPAVRVHAETPGTAPDTEGIDELRRSVAGFRAALPDLRISLEQLIGEDDLVAARWTARGTHRGPLAGIEATGRSLIWGGMDIYRIEGGRIAEWWRNDDTVGMLHQLGRDLLPTG